VVKILTSLLNEHLRKRTHKKITPRSYFYISEAGRSAFDIYRSMVLPQWYPPKIRRLLEIGNTTHKRVLRYLKEMGFLEAEGVKVGDELFRGVADAVIKLPGEETMPLEIKTVGWKEFERILRKGVPSWPSYIQLHLYLHYLDKKKGKLLFIETNTLEDFMMPLEEYRPEQRMKEFTIRKNPRVIAETIEKFKKLKEIFVEGGVMLR
jgi:hypothetical protein